MTQQTTFIAGGLRSLASMVWIALADWLAHLGWRIAGALSPLIPVSLSQTDLDIIEGGGED